MHILNNFQKKNHFIPKIEAQIKTQLTSEWMKIFLCESCFILDKLIESFTLIEVTHLKNKKIFQAETKQNESNMKISSTTTVFQKKNLQHEKKNVKKSWTLIQKPEYIDVYFCC